jgi:DNA polymerase-3 subunit alpha
VTVGGIVASLKQLTTKKGEPMVFAAVEDVTGGAEVVAFNSVYAQSRELLVPDRVLVIKGRIDHKQQGETKLIALEIAAFEATPDRREVRLKVDARIAQAGLIRELGDLVRRYPGEAPVLLDVLMTDGWRNLTLGPKVEPISDFFAEAKQLLGEAAVA